MLQLHVPPALSTPHLELAYLLIAAICLLSALHFLRIAVAPVAMFVRTITSAFLVALTICAALALLTISAFIH